MQILELLVDKECPVATVSTIVSVEEAITLLDEAGTGALIVTDGEGEGAQPVGIFAERDVLRAYLRDRTRPFSDISVKEAMTGELVVAEPEETVKAALATMIQTRIRHLPVIKDRQIVCVLTFSDLVKSQIGTLEAELHYLQDYITDLQDAPLD